MATNGDDREIDTVTLRVAAVVYRLTQGWMPTTREVAEYCGMGDAGAWAMLVRMSDIVPVYCDKDLGHRWSLSSEGAVKVVRHYVITA